LAAGLIWGVCGVCADAIAAVMMSVIASVNKRILRFLSARR
jgi:hypothetical protein